MYLGIDLGTSGIKAELIDDDQRPVASATAPLEVSRPHSGWSEQDPASWITATEAAIGILKRDHRSALSAVRGIGLSGQMHGATLLDDGDAVLRPCILWNDTRSHAEAAGLDEDPAFREISGNIVFPGFTAPKLVWVANNEPDMFARTASVLLPKDYLRLWLTGEKVSEMSDAAGTAWLDTGRRQWSGDLLEKTGMTSAQMPSLVEGTAVSGALRDELAALWGMSGHVAVAGGAGDNAASAVGMGVVSPGSAFVSLGTSGVLFASNAEYRPRPQSAVHAFCHAVPETWHQMGVILSATDSMNWLAGMTGTAADVLAGEVDGDLRAPGPATFLPYLSGERTPHNDAAIRGAVTGISHATDRAALTRAVMEGVAFAITDCQQALAEAGTQLTEVIAVGGGSRSRYWLKAVATAMGVPVHVPASGDFGAAFGAARLGMAAAVEGDPAVLFAPPEIAETIDPDTGLHDAFMEAADRFRRTYRALKTI